MDNIGGYSCLIKYLAEIEKTTTTKVVRSKEKPNVSGVIKYAFKDGIKYINPLKRLLKGGVPILETSDLIQLPIDTEFDYWEITISKGLEDFKTEIKCVGKAKICEGGGWYSWGHRYKVGDRLFEF